MRKRLLILFVMISTILCAFGCAKDPYEKMTLTTNSPSAVQLYIKDVGNNGSAVYEYPTHKFDVKVDNIGSGISPAIALSGGEGIVTYETIYRGNGVTTVNVIPISPEKTGKFTLLVKTLEGNKSFSIDFNIDLAINNFFIEEDRLKVISKGQSIDLNDLDKYITFDPVNTTEKDIKFDVVIPNGDYIEDTKVDDFYYEYDESLLENNVYAKVENNVLTTYTDAVYPVRSVNSVVGGDSETVQCITLKAYYENKDLPVRYVDIEVIENSSIVDLKMNFQTLNNSEYDGDGKSFVVNKNDSGEYDVMLLNPDYKDGMIYDSYYIERDLMFDFRFNNQGEHNFNDYFIDTETVLETADKPIVLSYSNIDNSFKVQAQKSGTHRQVFKLDHLKYPGIIDSEIVVNFHVVDLPTGMTINGIDVKDSYKIYDYYAASYGTRFNIDLNNSVGNFNYFVFTDNADYQEYLHIYKSDGVKQSLAVMTENANGKYEITSENYSQFRDRESFYLSHSFEEIPEEDVYIYVGLEYSVAAESYTDEIENGYFIKDYLKFPIKLKFEQGVKDLYFTQNKYMLDVTDSILRDNNEDYNGVKILDLPKGQTVQSLFETINYDRSLIHVYGLIDEVLGITSLYVKVNSEFAVGQTDLEVITRNGLKKTVIIETFVPSAYAINDIEKQVIRPLSINFDEQEVLYFENYGSDDLPAGITDPKAQYNLFDDDDLISYRYNSPETLILAKDHYVDLQFLDYLIANDGAIVRPIDITKDVRVTFSYSDYLTYNNGRLTAKKITADINNPVIMTVSYIGGYLQDAGEGVFVYKTFQETRNIEVYIYNILDGIKVSSPNEIELHLLDTLGYFDKGLATHLIKANFNPNSDDLGAQWNTIAEWPTTEGPVGLKYDINLENYIYNTDGSIKTYSYYDKDAVLQTYKLRYGDLFDIPTNANGNSENVTITAMISNKKIADNEITFSGFLKDSVSKGNSIDYNFVLSELMKNGAISLPIIITARQFDMFEVVAEIEVNLVPAVRIGQLVMDVDSDGVYFEVGEGAGNIEKSRTITYTTDTAHPSNNRMLLINSTNSLFTATCTPSKTTNGGKITINTLGGAGVEYLTIVPEDNVKDYDVFISTNGEEGLFDRNLLSQIRIKVADGSEAYPYEIKSVGDYDNMLDNISNKKFFHYYLTRNINLKDTSQRMTNITLPDKQVVNGIEEPVATQYFSLNGAYSYYKDGIEYNVISRLYNLTISTTTSKSGLNFGLFGEISGNVNAVIKNLSVMNARINITVDSPVQKDKEGNVIPVNVGILAGLVGENAQILNTQVYGNITIKDGLDSTESQQIINVGGMVGYSSNATIKGLPATYQTGIASTGYNTNVSIDYTSQKNNKNKYIYNVGGLIGNDNHTTINNLNIVSTIKGANYSGAIGGVVGATLGLKADNICAYPKINIKGEIESSTIIEGEIKSSIINVGGLVGKTNSDDSSISHSKVYFIREDVTQWDSKVGMYIDTSSTANVGGLIGSVDESNQGKQLGLTYSYVRSFYVGGIVEDSFHGDLYVQANNGTLGGLVGVGNNIAIHSSYFDADMAGKGVTIGAIMGSINDESKVENSYAITIQDAYAITDIYTISSGKLTEVIDNSVAMFGGLTFEPDDENFLGIACKKSSNSDITVENAYAVVNDYIYNFGEGNSVYAINGISKNGDELTRQNLVELGVSNLLETFKTSLKYGIVEDKADAVVSSINNKWLYNADANLAGGIALPILFNDHGGNQALAKAMFDVVPEKIVIDRIGKVDGFYDISEGENTHILMLVNTLDSNDKSRYQICVDSDSSAISIKFDGKTIVTRFIEINSDIIITENSNGSIISLDGAYITPVAEGTATITIRSALDKTVALNIDVTVIAKIKNVQLRVNEDNSYTSLEQGNPAQVYIDEGTYFKLFNVLNDQFVATNAYGYKLQLLEGQDSKGKININGKDYEYVDGEENIIDITNTNLLIKGVSIGTIKLKITPYYKVSESMIQLFKNCSSDEYTIKVVARARSINIKEENLKFEVKSSATFNVLVETSNVIIAEEKASEKFGDDLKDFDRDKDEMVYTIKILQSLTMLVNSSQYEICPLSDDELVFTNFVDNGEGYEITDNIKVVNGEYIISNFEQIINHEIINLQFSTIAIKLTDIDPVSSRNTYRVVLSAKATFDMQYYRENANYFDLNTIEYSFAFKPNSNKTLSDSIAIGITPSKVTNIYTNYYSKGELLGDNANEGETYPQENESNFIIPGRSGLLKITLDQEFNDSSYMELVLSDAYRSYLTVSQMSGKIGEGEFDSNISVDMINSSITNYAKLLYQEPLEDGRYGIKLTKMTLNYDNKSYFNNTYFVRFDLNRNYGNLQEISFQIISYTVGKTETTTLTRDFTYTVTQLPNVNVQVDNSSSSVLGLGVKKQLDITYSNITNDIHYSIGRTDADGKYEILKFEESKVYIADENGTDMRGTIKLEDLNKGQKYYLCADVSAALQKYSINFYVNEIVLGVKESATSTLAINLVDFEIDRVTVAEANDGLLTLLYGQQYAFAVNIDYKDIVIGDPAAIEAYKAQLDVKDGLVSMAEYAIAGTTVQKGDTSTNPKLRLSVVETYKGEKIRTLLENGKSYGYLYVSEGTLEDEEMGINLKYYILEAAAVTPENSPVNLVLQIPYEYTSDGHLLVDSGQTFEIEFKVVINDNSTYDHPNPIDNADELLAACQSGEGDYILVNNITLSHWVPQEALFESLDGNGYVITIESFDLTSFRGSNTANVGIFSSIPENTLIKNITVDIGSLLVTEKKVINTVEKVRNSTAETYVYDNLIDIAYTNTVNFGVIAAINNGAITNAKVVNMSKNTYAAAGTETSMYMHIVTNQGFNGTQSVVTNIGGIVAINESTGAITNSFVGINSATASANSSNTIESTINTVLVSGNIHHNNKDDALVSRNVYPFIIAGGNNIGGIVSQNSGIISNTYAKALGIFNTYPAVNNSKTAGFVATNDGKILSSFAESARSVHYRAIEDDFLIESTGNIGAFVYENSNIIENTYVDLFLETQSAFTGGFVFNNTESGIIRQSYTTAINKNSLAHGQFTGIASNGRDLLNQGTYENVYYILSREETENVNEDATAISFNDLISDADKKTIWRGFFFSTQVIEDGIWQLTDNSCPKIDMSETISFRKIARIGEHIIDGTTYKIYDYYYVGHTLGSKNNPLIIDEAKHFDAYIIDMGVALDKDVTGDNINDFVFGLNRSDNAISETNTVSYVRLVNNLDFSEITTAAKHNGRYLYQTVFAGALDGNGMTLSNLNINIGTSENGEENTVRQLDNFGLFAQIGVSSSNQTQAQSVIKNLNLSLSSYRTGEVNKAGILAGTIVNSNIVNVRINANSSDETLMVTGKHLSGGLAGLIYANGVDKVSIYDVTIENITLASTYGSLGGELTEESKDLSGGLYTAFSVKALESQTTVKRSFVQFDGENYTQVSYSGAVAGIIVANNTAKTVSDADNVRTLEQSSIEKIVVKNHVLISNADNAGGLFGYVGEGTLIKDSKFILNGEQLIKADNFAGGIVAENHGIIEQCSIAFDDETQKEMDNSLALESRVTSDYVLFDTSATSKNYSVAIGGIAGFSSNGVIIDSYAKVNVLKPTAYVAGGILGYSEGSNLIAYSYSTGAVYGQFVVGGIVGMQTSKKDNDDPPKVAEYLKMQNVIALTDWNYSSADYNYMNNITSKLYDNQKVLYANNGEYYNFYVKMPEIGNVGIIYQETETLDTEEYRDKKANKETYYKDLHKANNFFVGSVVGKFIIEGSTESIFDYTNADYAWVIGDSTNVFSNTLGRYSGSGNYNAGTRQDTYFADSSRFDYITATNNTVSLYSYRIAYPGSNSINAYQNITIDSSNTSAYFDVHNFPQLFTAQEYTQQIVGSYASIVDSSNLKTSNLFKYDYGSDQADRYKKNQSTSSWAKNNGNNFNNIIWKFDEILPTYNDGTYKSNISIKTVDELTNAFKSLGTGLTYNIDPNEYSITLNEVNTSIQYHNALRDVFNGVIKDGTRPKIKFIISDSISANTIFSALSGATLNNLDIEIVVNSLNDTNQYNDNFGILANTVQNITMNNCNVTLTIGSDIVIGQAEKDFQAHNFGALFGAVSASYFQGNKFVISAETITINNIVGKETLENIGLFAGYVDRTTFVDNTFTLDADIIISNCANAVNIGLVAGVVNNSTYKNNDIIAANNTINNSKLSLNFNAGGIFGYASQTTISGIMARNINTITFNLKALGQYNLASLVGRSYSSRFNDVISNDKIIVEDTTNAATSAANIGGFVGAASSNTSIERSTLSLSTDAAIVASGSYSLLSVGGFVGSAIDDTTLNSAVFNSKLSVTNNAKGTKIDDEYQYVHTNVGAMIGTTARGTNYIRNSYSAGTLIVNLLENDNSYMAGIGGFVGRAEDRLELDCFATFVDFAITNGNENTSVSGVVGINKSLLLATNGYSYVQLPKNDGIQTQSIATQLISSSTNNVFYAQEFVGNNYASDSLFRSFAMADLYDGVNPYSDISELLSSGFKKEKVEIQNSKLYLLIPETVELESSFANVSSNTSPGASRFNLGVISSDNVTIDDSHYYAVVEDITLSQTLTENSAIISGQSTETGKVVVTVPNLYVFEVNTGVISNIYLQTCANLNDKTSGKNISLVDSNLGLITNVYVYGYTKSAYSIAKTNSGRIYQSASATIYFGADQELSGLVATNDGTGIIADCYSGNFGITDNDTQVTQLYGLANKNEGTISNSYFYVPEIIEYDNRFIYGDSIKSAVNTNTQEAKLDNCKYGTANFNSSRSAVWTTENGHLQIRGIKDIAGSIVIRPLISGSVIDINTIANVKADLAQNKDYTFSYQTDFYVVDNIPDDYSVIKIETGDEFVRFINNLKNNNVPDKTIILLDFANVQKIGRLNTFNVPTSSMIIGLGASAIIESNNRVTYSTQLISNMQGVLANITFDKFVFNNESVSLDGFAPILYNTGVVYKVNFNNLTVNSGVARKVAVMIYDNQGSVVKCNVNTVKLIVRSETEFNGTINTSETNKFSTLQLYYKAGSQSNIISSGVDISTATREVKDPVVTA